MQESTSKLPALSSEGGFRKKGLVRWFQEGFRKKGSGEGLGVKGLCGNRTRRITAVHAQQMSLSIEGHTVKCTWA